MIRQLLKARSARATARRTTTIRPRGSFLGVSLACCALSSIARADCPIEPAHALDLARSLRPADPRRPLPTLAGSVVLVVNTASLCGYAPQLASLQTLHTRFSDAGLIVLAIPSNSFGSQEPGRSEDIPALYASRWGVTFATTAITPVTGGEAHALYLHLQHKLGDAGAASWNFAKYLFDERGDLIGLFGPSTDPLEPDVVEAVEDALALRKRAGAAGRTEL